METSGVKPDLALQRTLCHHRHCPAQAGQPEQPPWPWEWLLPLGEGHLWAQGVVTPTSPVVWQLDRHTAGVTLLGHGGVTATPHTLLEKLCL